MPCNRPPLKRNQDLLPGCTLPVRLGQGRRAAGRGIGQGPDSHRGYLEEVKNPNVAHPDTQWIAANPASRSCYCAAVRPSPIVAEARSILAT